MKKALPLVLCIALLLCVAPCSNATPSWLLPYGQHITLCGVMDPEMDLISWIAYADDYMEHIPEVDVVGHSQFNATELLNYIRTTDVFVIATHGSPTSIRAVDGDGNISQLGRDTIMSLPTNALADLDIAFLGACETGKTTTGNNMVEAFYAKGARCVIGYTDTVVGDCHAAMAKYFCRALAMEYSVREALAFADTRVAEDFPLNVGRTDQRYILGNTNIIIQCYPEERSITPRNAANGAGDIVLLSNENGTYGFFDPSKLSTENSAATPVTEDTAIERLNTYCQNGQEYVLSDFKYTSDTDTYMAYFTNPINGIQTSDCVIITLNAAGEVAAYSRPRAGAFDGVDVTEQMVQQAEDAMYTIYSLSPGSTTIESRCIVWDEDVLSVRFFVKTLEPNASTGSTLDCYTIPLA